MLKHTWILDVSESIAKLFEDVPPIQPKISNIVARNSYTEMNEGFNDDHYEGNSGLIDILIILNLFLHE